MMYKGKEAEEILGNILDSELPMGIDDGISYPLHFGDTGYYHDKKTGRWVAFDNTTGCCWVEEFTSYRKAADWCNGKEVASLTGYQPDKKK